MKTRSELLASVITAALLLLGMEREVAAGADTVTVGDILLQWTETWTQLASAVQQVVVLVVLDAVWPALDGLDAPASQPFATVE